MTKQAYAGDVEAFTGGSKVRRPSPVRDRWGRLRRAPGGEWDWFYELAPAERQYISSRWMHDQGMTPAELATVYGTTTDGAMSQWVTLVRLDRETRHADPLDDDYAGATESPDPLAELAGPVEVAAMLGVKVNTIAQWRSRFDDFPLPVLELSGVRIWDRRDVADWAKQHGRDLVDD